MDSWNTSWTQIGPELNLSLSRFWNSKLTCSNSRTLPVMNRASPAGHAKSWPSQESQRRRNKRRTFGQSLWHFAYQPVLPTSSLSSKVWKAYAVRRGCSAMKSRGFALFRMLEWKSLTPQTSAFETPFIENMAYFYTKCYGRKKCIFACVTVPVSVKERIAKMHRSRNQYSTYSNHVPESATDVIIIAGSSC